MFQINLLTRTERPQSSRCGYSDDAERCLQLIYDYVCLDHIQVNGCDCPIMIQEVDGVKSILEYRDKRFALVLVDIQRKFTAETEGLRESMQSRIGTVNSAIELFRNTGNPIVYVFFDGRGSCISGNDGEGDLLLEDLLPMEDGDAEVHKTCMNAFNGTGLGERLRNMGVDCVLIAGLVAHYCVLATYFGAFDQCLSPYILEGGIAATEEENVEMVERMFKTLSVNEMGENRYFGV